MNFVMWYRVFGYNLFPFSYRYSWTADSVLQDKLRWTREPQLGDLIPLESKRNSTSMSDRKRLIIGHNVGFDRSFVKEQYFIQVSLCSEGITQTILN